METRKGRETVTRVATILEVITTMLSEFSKQIDEVLAENNTKLCESLRDIRLAIEEQDKILQSDEAQGDRSENAVFQNAAYQKQLLLIEQAVTNDQINTYESNYRLYCHDNYVPTGKIKMGTCVKVLADRGYGEATVKLVPEAASNPLKQAISVTSLLGSALLNHAEGDVVRVETVAGVFNYKIAEVY